MTGHVNLLSPNTHDIVVPILRIKPRKAPPNMRRATSWADMAMSAENNDIELVLWKRPALSPVHATDDVPASDFEIILGEQGDILAEFNDTYTTSDWPAALRETVKQDLDGFLDAYEARLPESQYRLRLQAVSDDACRKFHQDRVFQRLIITYRGDGTVWRHVDTPLEHNAVEMECVLLRGKRGGQDAKIQHKSPVFTDGNPPRLMMVIDVIPSL